MRVVEPKVEDRCETVTNLCVHVYTAGYSINGQTRSLAISITESHQPQTASEESLRTSRLYYNCKLYFADSLAARECKLVSLAVCTPAPCLTCDPPPLSYGVR